MYTQPASLGNRVTCISKEVSLNEQRAFHGKLSQPFQVETGWETEGKPDCGLQDFSLEQGESPLQGLWGSSGFSQLFRGVRLKALCYLNDPLNHCAEGQGR